MPTLPQLSPIQWLLLTESLLNLSSLPPMLFTPRAQLSTITATSTPATTLSTQLLQLYAALILGLTLPMFAVIPQQKHDGVKRRMVYWFLLSGEGFRGNGEDKAGLSRRFMQGAAGVLTAFGAVRGWVMYVKAEWFTDGDERKRVE